MTSIHFGIQLSGGIIGSFDVLNYHTHTHTHRSRERDHILFPFCVCIKKKYNKTIEIFIDIKTLNHIKACNSIQFSAGIYYV